MKNLESLKNKKFDLKKIKGGQDASLAIEGGGNTYATVATATPCGCPKADRVLIDHYV